MRPSPKRLVALLIETTNGYARGLLHGVARYTHECTHWQVYFELHSPDSPPPKWFKGWKGDGILARIESRRMAQAILDIGVPVVELRRKMKIPGVPAIGPDHHEVARLAIEHLKERGFRQFGFCGLPRAVDPPMDHRADAFIQQLKEAGLPCSVFPTTRNVSWDQELRSIARWIASLPKPLGVMTCDDTHGLRLLQACGSLKVAVPDHVAILGVGNDDCVCSLCHPSLSSVDLAPATIGYEAAALLDRMMAKKRPSPEQNILVPPRGIVMRLSTDVLATSDQAVSQAIGFIRSHACNDVLVRDVLQHVKLSRSALEPKLKRVVGRTLHQEIRRVQIERAKNLLATTDLPTKQIADQTGFHYVQYLSRVFRKTTGQTPANYRKQARR
jgi:LacI family transcriptional regulator